MSIDDVNDSESYELDEGRHYVSFDILLTYTNCLSKLMRFFFYGHTGYIIDSDNDENYNSGEVAAHNDTMTILAHQVTKFLR